MEHSVIFFDGICNLCNQTVLFVIKRDERDRFRFAPLQGPYAVAHLSVSHTPGAGRDSVLLLEDGKIYTESTAVLRIARGLGGIWSLLYIFIGIPPFIRNGIYRWIARRRYRVWGKKESCMVPTPELRSKFL